MLVALPGVLDVGEGNPLGVEAEFATGDAGHELLVGVDPPVGRGCVAAAVPEDWQPGAA